jgi:hypothetical protein
MPADRDRILNRWSALKTERKSFEYDWRDVSTHMLPRSGRFFSSDRNKGGRRNNKIIDNTSTRALRTLAAAMVAGMSSPATMWFRLTTSIPELDESHAVKKWLSDCERMMMMVFASTNTYRALHAMYEELGAYGTAANIIVDDFEKILHNHQLTIGEYAIACNNNGRVDTIYREFDMTVSQIVEEYGVENVSNRVKAQYDRGDFDSWVTVLHAIEPRRGRDATKRDAANMRWQSVAIEISSEKGKILRESGFEEFPALCPRWIVRHPDVYGEAPALDALGDVKQLQHEQLRKAKAIDYQSDPALVFPADFKNIGVNTLPGGRIFGNMMTPTQGVLPVYDARYANIEHLVMDIEDVRKRINSALYADLILMMAAGGNPQMTATEANIRQEEKLMTLGPVLERLQNEILDPLINIAFVRLVSAGVLPPPPQELQGMQLNVEYVSMMAQSQRAFGMAAVDRFISNLGVVAQMKPDVLDKFDADSWADVAADNLGVPPQIIVPGETVTMIRQQRAQQQQEAQAAEEARQGADMAAKLGGIDMSRQNAFSDLLSAEAVS